MNLKIKSLFAIVLVSAASVTLLFALPHRSCGCDVVEGSLDSNHLRCCELIKPVPYRASDDKAGTCSKITSNTAPAALMTGSAT